MNNRKLDDKKLREIQMKNGGKGPGGRFGGLKEKPKNLKQTFTSLIKYIAFSKKLLFALIIVVLLSTSYNPFSSYFELHDPFNVLLTFFLFSFKFDFAFST